LYVPFNINKISTNLVYIVESFELMLFAERVFEDDDLPTALRDGVKSQHAECKRAERQGAES
jgi:hypothetical protein